MEFKTALALGFQAMRTAQYAGQQFSLPFLERLATGKTRPTPPDIAEKRKLAFEALRELIKKDSENIGNGIYPLEVLKPEAPLKHWTRFGRIILDGLKISKRRDARKAHDFSGEAEQYLNEVPDYYRRNFHYQTGGYLTRESAELYEHQVEILFSGGADAMRRLLLPMMKEKYSGDGEGLHFLEIAAGTGRLSRFVKLAYPKARVTVTDLSWPYLEIARERLSDLSRVEFMQAAAEKLPFQDQTYDAVFSCFLFHELPEKVRHEVVREGMRVLKNDGVFGMVDSLQANDAEESFNWALDQFPQDFHEPFFKNYTLHSMESLFKKEGLKDVQKDIGFLSKAVMGVKKSANPKIKAH